MPSPQPLEVLEVMQGHLAQLHRSYGEHRGVRIARKHIGWYLQGRPDSLETRRHLMRCENAKDQFHWLREYFLKQEMCSQMVENEHRKAA